MLKKRLTIPLIAASMQAALAAEPNTINHPSFQISEPFLQTITAETLSFESMDQLAHHVIRQMTPEFQSAAGFSDMHGQSMTLKENHNSEWKKTFETLVALIESESSVVSGLSDLQRAQKSYVAGCFKDYVKLIEANDKYKRITLFMPLNFSDGQDLIDPISFMFGNIQALTLKQVSTDIIVQQLKGYVQAKVPLCQGVMLEILKLMKSYGNKGLYPCQKYLFDIVNPEKINSFKKQMAEWLPNEVKLCQEFNEQIDGYVAFIVHILLPKGRVQSHFPAEIYKLMLKINGVDWPTCQLIQQGKSDFEVSYKKFVTIANQISNQKGDLLRYPLDNPAAVLTSLAEDAPFSSEEETIAMYKDVQAEIEKIIIRENFITLPQRSLRMRPGTSAEEASFPVPHVNTPSFINNTGDADHFWPEFVLCDLKGNTSPSGAPALCAHEGRPGHDLQFSRMVEETLEGKMNLFQTVLASNSTNAEGWAHYVEYQMAPHFTFEAQLGALQDQLMRMARMFLDPQINLGFISHADVVEFHQKKLGLGETAAKSEADRYSFLMPGQAVTYRFGALQIMNLRKSLEEKLGDKFSQKDFHDAILSHGLMPLEMVKGDIEAKMMGL